VSDARETTFRDAGAYRAGAYDAADDVRAPAWEDAIAASAPVGLVAPDAPLAREVADGNLRRYARWQWRDYWQRRGFWLAGAALFGVWVLVHWMLADRIVPLGEGGVRSVPVSAENVMAMSHVAFAVGGVLAGLLGVGGLVARERERGLQRFLFAKPVNIVRYYLQGFAVNGVGSLLVLGGAVLLAAATAPQALAVGTMFAVAAGGYLLGGGITFLLSTLLRFDAPLAGAYLLAGFPAVALAENGFRWAMVVRWLFPQSYALALARPMFDNPNPPLATIGMMFVAAAVFAALWGAACVAAAVAVLRRRAISA
jgi:ABC-type transport system involved in multi-copper enzyme maturation permease subunit